jgi:hypothetical protein
LKVNFPDLCSSLGAEVFYAKYRCGAVHEFGMKEGLAIGRDSGMKGAYVETQDIADLKRQNTVLNIDRLVHDFLKHLDNLLTHA